MATIDDVNRALPKGCDIEKPIKGGGQGSVFKGSYDGEPAAIKLFAPTAEDERVKREVDLLREMDCPYVVRLKGFHSITVSGQDLWVVVYEFLSEGDLRSWVTGSGTPPSKEELVLVGAHVGNAIDALWQKRVVHRDVKPDNILRGDDDRYVLADVGLARHIDLASLTAAGLALGTTGYMSPEQGLGRKHLTVHSDVFSLGITLYELAARKHPFNHNQGLVGRQSPASLATLRPDLPTVLTRLIDEMLAVSPSQRPREVGERFARL